VSYYRPISSSLVKEDEFPAEDAIANILPEYSLTPNDLQLYNVPTNASIPLQRQATTTSTVNKLSSRQPTDPRMQSVIGEREKELNRYKDAVKRMSHDIVNLRQENLGLKTSNQVPRRDHQETSRTQAAPLLTYRTNNQGGNATNRTGFHDPNLVDSAELVEELEEVNDKLAKGSVDLQRYKARVQHLQNQVIKANEREKKYLSEEMTRNQLEDAVTELHGKVKKTHKLEETVLKQEKVILKMEDLLRKFQEREKIDKEAASKKPKTLPPNEDVLASLTKQNNQLHLDLKRIQETQNLTESNLKVRLERAENRAATLEEQLVRNARDWAREKNELTVRLQEHRNGIIRKNAVP